MLGKIGLSELLLAGGLILLIFGPKKLPEIGRSFGKGLREFKQATKELTDSVQLDEETNE
ncbi:twin-arginine translocase TatA/TatE family subunit [Dethiobacter alkaliphilus]|uniref:Sec-independent protein translocase protein TatA n=1 Tax=Dethiobacter alkaliphilus AHT 1 TaxID=555088 RepID=C0GFM6_DETAL|nr:twin-arginine translocase TatA/TatE family subunit [Dethiobacter alkaliphilus]EEG77986.1 twin-arginine translocation protein, TatA/E family subunit [Dethiobacter alkaliphilus AHT 1]